MVVVSSNQEEQIPRESALMRFFFCSHDGFGLGHTRRHLAIATALSQFAQRSPFYWQAAPMMSISSASTASRCAQKVPPCALHVELSPTRCYKVFTKDFRISFVLWSEGCLDSSQEKASSTGLWTMAYSVHCQVSKRSNQIKNNPAAT